MKLLMTLILILSFSYGDKAMKLYDIDVTTIDGKQISMNQYKDKVLLIVNVASFCGFTPQYEGLQALYKKYKDQGFEVLAFPCNQFMEQEPQSHEEIKSFCSINYNVTFDMFEKIDVNGDNTHPLYVYLKSKSKGFLQTSSIKWNFTKFLVSKDGTTISRYSPYTKPKELEEDIEKLLSM